MRTGLPRTTLVLATFASFFTLGAPVHAGTLAYPTPAAIARFRSTALRPSRLDAWWRGYLRGPVTLSGCHRSGPVYLCRIVDVSDVLAMAGLVRTSGCGYAYELQAVGNGPRLSRRFTLCG